jgi:hypothetical protein
MSFEVRSFAAGVVFFVIGILIFISGLTAFKMKRLIENIPTSKIRSIAMGLVEINGKTIAKKLLKSPFSKKNCVYYRYTIEEYRRSRKNSRWVTIKRGLDGVPFILKDNTGTVLVEPKGAKVDIPKDFEFRSGFRKDPPIAIKQFLKSSNLKFESFIGVNRTMRYREYFIAPNDNLYIIGTAGDNPFVKEASAKEGTEDIMIQKGKNEKFYYISDKAEKDVVKSFKFKTFGGLFGGAALIILGLVVILINLGLF